jgi:hypothetical protein
MVPPFLGRIISDLPSRQIEQREFSYRSLAKSIRGAAYDKHFPTKRIIPLA